VLESEAMDHRLSPYWQLHELARFETERIFGFDWSPDGSRLACVHGLWATNAVLIKNFS
jgi:hypothetical protein